MHRSDELATVAPIAELVMAAVHREYPSQISHSLRGDSDARPPRELTPAFYGSYDWHSAVHGHWCLARLVRRHPTAPFAERARTAIAHTLTSTAIAGEVAYLSAPGRTGFEVPYGLAWLLTLAAELREWDDRDARAWRTSLAPLEALAAARLRAWLPKLRWPLRSGVHSNSAFAFGLALDWTRVSGDVDLAQLLATRARELYGRDVAAPIAYEPSGTDFLSPALAEADLMRRVLPPDDFGHWLDRFLPDLGGDAAQAWLAPVTSPDSADGQLSHLDGLNLSRAWMLDGVAAALPSADSRRPRLLAAAEQHGRAGLASVTADHYAGAHWLGTFAVYRLTRRGVPTALDAVR